MKQLLIALTLAVLVITGCNDGTSDVPEETKETVVSISNLSYGHHYMQSELTVLKGSAYAFNGDFSNDIQWYSDRDGALGQGAVIEVLLSGGRHMLTATADNGFEAGEDANEIHIMLPRERIEYEVKDNIAEVQDRDGDTFIINRTKGTVLDTSTNLMWQRSPDTVERSYRETVAYAGNSKLGGHSDWRVPTKAELIDIHNIYYDGRHAILHHEFNEFEGEFFSSGMVTLITGDTHRFTVELDDIMAGTNQSLLSIKGMAGKLTRCYVRLVRNSN